MIYIHVVLARSYKNPSIVLAFFRPGIERWKLKCIQLIRAASQNERCMMDGWMHNRWTNQNRKSVGRKIGCIKRNKEFSDVLLSSYTVWPYRVNFCIILFTAISTNRKYSSWQSVHFYCNLIKRLFLKFLFLF